MGYVVLDNNRIEFVSGHRLVLLERDSRDLICPSTGLLQNLISLCGTCGTQFVPPRDFYKNGI